MKKRYQNIVDALYPSIFICFLIFVWSLISYFKIVPPFMLPSPKQVLFALVNEREILLKHSITSLTEAFIGLFLSIILALITAVIMDESNFIKKTIYPIIILTQTIPTIAIAPLIVLWLGYGIAPKIALIFITCFFPIVVSVLGGLSSVDKDLINLFKSMGATRFQILTLVKLPSATESFFSGVRVAASYAIVGAVIAEWLGGNSGLGVYMTRVRKSYSFDKMFAVIIVVSLVSLLLIKLVDLIQKRVMPWKNVKN